LKRPAEFRASFSQKLDHARAKHPPLPTAVDSRAEAGGYKVKDAHGQSLAYVYGRETRADADTAGVLTLNEARRIAGNIAKLPTYLMAHHDTSD
jgi:hypothetical protein